MDSSVAHIHLAIDLESNPIAGSVSSPGEQARAFSGWIDLVEAIEQARIEGRVLRTVVSGGARKD